MALTIDEVVEGHRKMWKWIADETRKRERCVNKPEYFVETGFDVKEIPYMHCFCCQYAFENTKDLVSIHLDCTKCAIDWGTEPTDYESTQCYNYKGSPYYLWAIATDNDDWELAAKYAEQIANLPVREVN